VKLCQKGRIELLEKVGRALAFFIKRTFDVVEFFNLLELLVLWFEIVPYQMRCMTLRMRF
jgi:hypothetical protein